MKNRMERRDFRIIEEVGIDEFVIRRELLWNGLLH